MADDELPPPSTRNPGPAPTIPVPATSRPAPGMGSTGPPWWCLGSWRRHWRTARRRTTRRGTAGRWRHGLPIGDNGKSDDCKRRQDFSSMYHGILLITAARPRSKRRSIAPSVEVTVPHLKGRVVVSQMAGAILVSTTCLLGTASLSRRISAARCRGQDRLSGPLRRATWTIRLRGWRAGQCPVKARCRWRSGLGSIDLALPWLYRCKCSSSRTAVRVAGRGKSMSPLSALPLDRTQRADRDVRHRVSANRRGPGYNMKEAPCSIAEE